MKSVVVSLQMLALLALSTTGIRCAAPTDADEAENAAEVGATP